MDRDYRIIHIGNIRLRCIASSTREDKHQADMIDKIWSNINSNRTVPMFNGAILSYCGCDYDGECIEILGSMSDYKHFIAQREAADLKLDIMPIGVSGLIVLKENNNEYIAFAKRSFINTQYKGYYELIPSGSIDDTFIDQKGFVDYKRQLMKEYIEETGLADTSVTHIEGFSVIEDISEKVYDVGCEINVNINIHSFLEKTEKSEEYRSPVLVPVDELGSFVSNNYDYIIPTSRALIDAYMHRQTTTKEG